MTYPRGKSEVPRYVALEVIQEETMRYSADCFRSFAGCSLPAFAQSKNHEVTSRLRLRRASSIHGAPRPHPPKQYIRASAGNQPEQQRNYSDKPGHPNVPHVDRATSGSAMTPAATIPLSSR